MRLNYWPAIPSRPSIAFSFSLLDWLQALLLECQVPVQDFSNALEFIITTKYVYDKVSISYCGSDLLLINIIMHIIDALQYLSCAH